MCVCVVEQVFGGIPGESRDNIICAIRAKEEEDEKKKKFPPYYIFIRARKTVLINANREINVCPLRAPAVCRATHAERVYRNNVTCVYHAEFRVIAITGHYLIIRRHFGRFCFFNFSVRVTVRIYEVCPKNNEHF